MLDYAVFNIHRLRSIHERGVRRTAAGNNRPTTLLLTLTTLMQIDRKQSAPDAILRDSRWGKRAMWALSAHADRFPAEEVIAEAKSASAPSRKRKRPDRSAIGTRVSGDDKKTRSRRQVHVETP